METDRRLSAIDLSMGNSDTRNCLTLVQIGTVGVTPEVIPLVCLQRKIGSCMGCSVTESVRLRMITQGIPLNDAVSHALKKQCPRDANRQVLVSAIKRGKHA